VKSLLKHYLDLIGCYKHFMHTVHGHDITQLLRICALSEKKEE